MKAFFTEMAHPYRLFLHSSDPSREQKSQASGDIRTDTLTPPHTTQEGTAAAKGLLTGPLLSLPK